MITSDPIEPNIYLIRSFGWELPPYNPDLVQSGSYIIHYKTKFLNASVMAQITSWKKQTTQGYVHMRQTSMIWEYENLLSIK